MMSEVAIANVGADGDFIAPDDDLGEWEATDIDKVSGREDIELHEVNESGTAGEEGSLGVGGDCLGGGFGGAGLCEGKRVHLKALLSVLDGFDDVGISTAAADVATHAFANFGWRELLAGGFSEQGDGGHNLAGRAIAALKPIKLQESFLHGMKRAVV